MKQTVDVREGKTGARKVVSQRRYIIERLKNSKTQKLKDLIFTDNEAGKAIVEDTHYEYWKLIMNETILIEKIKFLFYYQHQTHEAWKLHTAVDVFTLSRLLRTSVNNISAHSNHIHLDKNSDFIVSNDRLIIFNQTKLTLKSKVWIQSGSPFYANSSH